MFHFLRYPPKKFDFFRYFVSKQIHRKSQHETFPYIRLLGVSERLKVAWGPKDHLGTNRVERLPPAPYGNNVNIFYPPPHKENWELVKTLGFFWLQLICLVGKKAKLKLMLKPPQKYENLGSLSIRIY